MNRTAPTAAPLTTRQSDALNRLASTGAARFTIRGTARYPRYSTTSYDADGQVIPFVGCFVFKSVFAALVRKGAVLQLDHPTRPGVCIGYRVA